MTTVSTHAFYDRSNQSMASLRTRSEGLQGQIASGERLTRSSQDPVAAARLRALSRADTLAAVDTTIANRAASDLQLADDALSGFTDGIVRVQELATQAANGTLNPTQRAAIGQELNQLNARLLALANARDGAGHALFGGEAAGVAYTVDGAGNAAYAGTANPGSLALGDGQSVIRGVTGPQFLSFSVSGTGTDLFATIKGLADALQGGVADPAGAARASLSALDAGLASISTAQTVVGARLNFIDLATTRSTQRGEARAIEEAAVGGTDIAAAITRLEQTMTALEASQASFARLSSLSLFDQIR